MVLGVVRPGPSFTMTTPKARTPAAPTQSVQAESPYTGPYKGVEPGTISAQPFLDYMGQVENMALDPRNEIRDREQQRLQEQTRAGLAQRGLNLSGAGQGIENQAMTDFGLDWQNQQLGRAGQGAQMIGSLGSQAQNIAQAGFSNAMDLGAAQFEYEPEVAPQPAFSYGGHSSYSPGFGGGFGGGGGGMTSGQQWRQGVMNRNLAQNQGVQASNAAAIAESQQRRARAFDRMQRYQQASFAGRGGSPAPTSNPYADIAPAAGGGYAPSPYDIYSGRATNDPFTRYGR